MNIERLEHLAGILESYASQPIHDVEFDLGFWGKRSGCGTAACAIGLSCEDPEFQRQGLNFYWEETTQCEKTVLGITHVMIPCYAGRINAIAIAVFFNIDCLTVEHLFLPSSYSVHLHRGIDGALAVAARIREVVAKEREARSEQIMDLLRNSLHCNEKQPALVD